MASQVVGLKPPGRSAIGVNLAGVILGFWVGGLHLLWAALVASGWARPRSDGSLA